MIAKVFAATRVMIIKKKKKKKKINNWFRQHKNEIYSIFFVFILSQNLFNGLEWRLMKIKNNTREKSHESRLMMNIFFFYL